MSKYERVAEDLQSKINDGTYKSGQRLPTIPELAEMYGVSSITIKHAMDELDRKGLVARQRGSGTYVLGPKHHDGSDHRAAPVWRASTQLKGFSYNESAKGTEVTSEVHLFSVEEPPEAIANYLGMESDTFAFHIRRTRYANGEPHAVEDMYMPISVLPGLRRKHAENSIYQFIEKELGHHVASAHRIVRAVNPSPEEAEWLQVEPSCPILEIEQIAFLSDGTPFEWSVSRFSRTYELYTVLSR